MKLTWTDLLIEDLSPEDCERWLGEWSWLADGLLAPAFLNKFGSWFLRRPEGHVELLDVFAGTLEPIADTYEQFIAEVNEQWWQEIYLLSKLVYELHRHGMVPGPGQCYALAPHPALGGPNPSNGEHVDPRFVMVMDVGAWQTLCVQSLRH